MGEKRWNCDIALVNTADDGTVWHEMLHSCLVSYYDADVYSAHKWIEESSVEFLSQQICKVLNIVSVSSYGDYTDILQVLNDKFQFGTDMQFAKDLFNVPLPNRYQWLENKVELSLREMRASFEDFNEVMHYIKKLRGGNDE